MDPFLQIRNVSFSYFRHTGEVPVIDNLSFSVAPGEFVAIVGPSGCGKTTLLSLLAGLLEPMSGSITMGGPSVKDSTHTIGYMLQKDHLLEWRTTKQNIALGLEIHRRYTPENEQKLDAMLSDYGLLGFSESKPSELSGGMRQRAALIRTLMQKPNLLLLDEPFSALDAQTRLLISNDVHSVIKEFGITAILITHDISEAISMADRVLVLDKIPTKIVAEHPIAPELAELSPLDSRNSPLFQDYFRTLWKELMS